MTTRFASLAVVSATAALTLGALARPAHADVVFSAGVHVSGGVAVGVGYGPPPPPPVYYAPEPVYYAPPPPPPPPVPYYAPPPPPPCAQAPLLRPRFGIGLYASASQIGDEQTGISGAGGGVSLRLRLGDRFELEGLVGQDHFNEVPRVDTRVGMAGIFNFGSPGGFRPYVLLGAGLNVIDPTGDTADKNPDAQLPTQGYVEAGLGVSWELARSFVLAGEWRVQARHLSEDQTDRTYARGVTVPPSSDPADADRETASELRLSATFWF